MRGILLEKGKSYYLVLTRNGQYKRLKGLTDASIGQEVNVHNYSPYIRTIALAVAIVLVSTLTASVYPMFDSHIYAYITVEGNQGVEFAVNRKNTVVSARAYDPEAEVTLSMMEYDGLEIEKVIDEFTKTVLLNDSVEEELDDVVVSYYSIQGDTGEGANVKLEQIMQQQRATIESSGHKIEVDTLVIDKETREEAERQGISPGRLKKEDSSNPPRSSHKEGDGRPDNFIKDKGNKGKNEMDKDQRGAEKTQEEALKQAEKAEKEALKQAEKAEKEALKQAEKAQKEGEKESRKIEEG